VFTRRKVAVFVDGCFWHSCAEHGRTPSVNHSYWTPKLARTVERDALNNEALRQAGWVVVRVWEHQCTEDAIADVVAAIGARASSPGAP